MCMIRYCRTWGSSKCCSMFRIVARRMAGDIVGGHFLQESIEEMDGMLGVHI